jgi:hypothetical protein
MHKRRESAHDISGDQFAQGSELILIFPPFLYEAAPQSFSLRARLFRFRRRSGVVSVRVRTSEPPSARMRESFRATIPREKFPGVLALLVGQIEEDFLDRGFRYLEVKTKSTNQGAVCEIFQKNEAIVRNRSPTPLARWDFWAGSLLSQVRWHREPIWSHKDRVNYFVRSVPAARLENPAYLRALLPRPDSEPNRYIYRDSRSW